MKKTRCPACAHRWTPTKAVHRRTRCPKCDVRVQRFEGPWLTCPAPECGHRWRARKKSYGARQRCPACFKKLTGATRAYRVKETTV